MTIDDIKNAKNEIQKYEENTKDFIYAAAIGGAMGVLLTGVSDKSTPVTLGLSALVACAYAVGVANTPEFGLYDADAKNIAIVGGCGFAYSAIVGAVANHFIGKNINEKDYSDL